MEDVNIWILMSGCVDFSGTRFLPRDAMGLCVSATYAVMLCLSVCVSVCPSRSCILSKRINIFKIFSPSGSEIILVFPYQTAWQYSNGNYPNWGIECRCSRQKSRFWANIWFHCVMLTLLPARCCQHDVVRPPYRKLWHLISKRRCLLMAGKYGKMFMTSSFNVNRIAFNCTQW